jgi:hypothetical protein
VISTLASFETPFLRDPADVADRLWRFLANRLAGIYHYRSVTLLFGDVKIATNSQGNARLDLATVVSEARHYVLGGTYINSPVKDPFPQLARETRTVTQGQAIPCPPGRP